MIYRKIDCPCCGNEIIVNNGSETQKCCWCRRLISVKFKRRPRGKKLNCEAEVMDFPQPQPPFQRQKSYSKWKDKDIYGK